MQLDLLREAFAIFVFGEYCRPQSKLSKANRYISGACDRKTRIQFLKITQGYIIFNHLVWLASMLVWYIAYVWAIYCGFVYGCEESLFFWGFCVLIGIVVTILFSVRKLILLIVEYRNIEKNFSFCILDPQEPKELS